MKKCLTLAAVLCLITTGAFANVSRASWYHEGRLTATGERFKPDGFTVAHRTLPFGTIIKVCRGHKCALARVNDRGPAAWTGRSLDLSRGVARALGMLSQGVASVVWAVVK